MKIEPHHYYSFAFQPSHQDGAIAPSHPSINWYSLDDATMSFGLDSWQELVFAAAN
jgi:hypothetical protein